MPKEIAEVMGIGIGASSLQGADCHYENADKQELKSAVTATTTQTTSNNNSVSQSVSSTANFPVIMIATLSDLQVGIPISFNYPLEETPNILVKLGQQAQGGVGPDNDIVAFSQICQHMGCIYEFTGSWFVTTLRSEHILQSLWASRILLLPRKRIRSCKRS